MGFRLRSISGSEILPGSGQAAASLAEYRCLDRGHAPKSRPPNNPTAAKSGDNTLSQATSPIPLEAVTNAHSNDAATPDHNPARPRTPARIVTMGRRKETP